MFSFFEEEPKATNVAENNENGVQELKSWQIADMNGFLLKQAKDALNFSKGLTCVLLNHTISQCSWKTAKIRVKPYKNDTKPPRNWRKLFKNCGKTTE